MFFAHSHKFLLIACLFFVPLFLIDEWLYYNILYLEARNFYTLLDGGLYVCGFLLWVVYYIALNRSIEQADEKNRIDLVSCLAAVKRHFIPCLWVQINYVVKILAWSVLFLIPGFFSACFYSFAGLAVLFDQKKGRDAFVASKQAIASQLNKYFDMVVLSLILQAALFVPFYLFLGYVQHFFDVHFYFGRFLIYVFLVYLLVFIHLVIFQIFYYYLYKELRKGEHERH